MSKLQRRSESPLPSTSQRQPESMSHVRKSATKAVEAAAAETQVLSEDTMMESRMTPAEEEAKGRPIVKILSEPPSLNDILKKMRRESGTYNFIPLSTGKFLCDIWWEPMEVYVTESKRLNGVPWLLMTVKIFVDTAGNTADIDAREMEVKFRCDFAEVLRISFLRDRLMKDLHSERVLSYEDWYRDVAGKCALSECESDAHFAKRVFDLTMALAITRIPRNFHVFFCKKPHQKFEGIEAVDTILNKNSMLCRASGKSDFYYEFRVRLFVIGDELVSSKKLKRLEEMDIVPDSQPL